MDVKNEKEIRFLKEMIEAFDYSNDFNGLAKKERMRREGAMTEINKIKYELEKESRMNYRNLIEQIIINTNLAIGLQIWAAYELNRIDNNDIVRLRRQQIKKMKKMRNQTMNTAVQYAISAIISDYSGKNNLSDDYTLSCKDNTKSEWTGFCES